MRYLASFKGGLAALFICRRLLKILIYLSKNMNFPYCQYV